MRPCYGPTAGVSATAQEWRRVASGNGRRRNSPRRRSEGPGPRTATHAAAGDDRGSERRRYSILINFLAFAVTPGKWGTGEPPALNGETGAQLPGRSIPGGPEALRKPHL